MPVEPKNSSWFVYPQEGQKFLGFYTKDDPTKIPDLAFPNGQNTTPNQGDRISIRAYGYELFPNGVAFSSVTEPSKSLWTFHKRDGSQILIVAQGDSLAFFDEETQTYANLEDGYTSDDFGFAEMNINTDQSSYLYFGNGKEDFSRWTGNHTNLNGALVGGEAVITVDSTLDFPASGTLRIGTTDVTYSGTTATTFTGCTGTPAAADRTPVAQGVQTFPSNPKGNIYMASDNRLFIAGIENEQQAVYFSRYADATDFFAATIITTGTADDPGIFNLVEGGGAVTAMVKDEQSNYFFKENIIYAATLTDAFYTLLPLKPFDGRSQTTGATSKRSVFVGGNMVFFVSKDNQIYALQRVQEVDYPQMVPISHIIEPTANSLDFSTVTGIVYKQQAYFACKQSPESTVNDAMLVFNIVDATWDTPVVNLSVGEFAVYKTGGRERLLFGDSFTSNVWIVNNSPVDYIYNTLASVRTKPYDFGDPSELKELDAVFLEGYIDDNTRLTVNLYLDEDGFTSAITTVIAGTETQFLFEGTQPNAFGLHPFGFQRFGSNDDTSGKKKFRIYLNKNLRRIPFYTAQLEFISDGSNQNWEILRYGFLVRQHSQPIPTDLMRNW